MTVIDCVKSPPVDAMRAAGVTGVCRYLSWADQRDTLGKVIHQPEYDQLRAAGFDVLLNWEYAAQDYLGGAMRGASHAQEAIRQARALGYAAGCAIVGSADHDVTRADWLGTGRAYYMAFSSGLRVAGYRAGIYGPWDVLGWARDDDVADVFWQAGMSTSWSGGRNAALWPGAHLRQRRNGFVGGFDVDFNDIIQANYGQYAVDAAAITLEDNMAFIAVDAAGQHYLCDGFRSRPVSPGDAGTLIYLAQSTLGPAVQLMHVDGNNAEWQAIQGNGITNGWVRKGWTPAFGALDTAAPAPVTMTDADRQAIADKMAAQLGAKLDAVTAAVEALGTREAAAAQAEADALKG